MSSFIHFEISPWAGTVAALLESAFWLWMLVDCFRNEKERNCQKLGWALAICFAGWLGAIAYFFIRREPRVRTAHELKTKH